MVRILTDSTADIDDALAAQLDIAVVPLKVVFGEECYRDGLDLTNRQFYEMLLSGSVLPTTSQPSPEDFLVHFEAAKQAGDQLIVLTLSAAVSGTYQSAIIAKEMCAYSDIFVIDSKLSVCGLRLLVEQAVRMRSAGMSAFEMTANLTEMRSRVKLYALVDTLEYFYKGGRLSKTGHIAGTLFHIKPVITLENGVLTVAGKARGRAKAIEFILDKIASHKPKSKDVPVYFGYTAHQENLYALIKAAKERFGYEQEIICPVGSVIGTHAGPGAAIIAILEEK